MVIHLRALKIQATDYLPYRDAVTKVLDDDPTLAHEYGTWSSNS